MNAIDVSLEPDPYFVLCEMENQGWRDELAAEVALSRQDVRDMLCASGGRFMSTLVDDKGKTEVQRVRTLLNRVGYELYVSINTGSVIYSSRVREIRRLS